MSSGIKHILDKAIAGERLTPEDGLALLQSHDLIAIGKAADAVTRRLHPEPYRTYNIDRNINYTNACAAVCDFCAFYRPIGHEEVYVLTQEALHQKVQETVDLGGDQILMQGGLHPKLPLETVLQRLKDAGLGSVPGGGGEILVDRVRKLITRGKVLTDDWLNVNRVWHQLGGKSTCTMMFGHVETLEERIEHLDRLRSLQDETGGFTAFICWTHQPPHEAPWYDNRKDGVDMSKLHEAGAFEYLKTQAIGRLYLDNIPNIQSSWVTQGEKIGQVALAFGANDMGSLMIEENVVSKAGTVYHLSVETLRKCIREAGYIPRQRNVFYDYIDEADQTGQGETSSPAASVALPVLN